MFRSLLARTSGAFLVALGVGAIALPASAGAAASVDVPGKSCYSSYADLINQPISVKARGLKPGAEVRVELRIDDETVSGTESLTVDSEGRLITMLGSWTTGFPDGPTGPNPAQVVVTDFILGHVLASHDITVANMGLWIDDAPVMQATPRRWIMSGLSLWGGGDTYYAHYFTEKPFKQFSTVRLGPATGRCGYLKIWKPLLPARKLGKFVVYVQNSQKFNKNLPMLGYGIKGYLVKQ